MEILIEIVGLVLVLLLLVIVIFSFLLAHYNARPKITTLEKELAFEEKHGFLRDYADMPKEDCIVKSYDGYEIHAVYVPAAVPSNKYVIISHGYTGCRLGSIKYLHLFRNLGYNCFMQDHRDHGENAPTACTMGFRESRDLMAVIDYMYERFGQDIFLGLHGESMGAGLTINALQYHPRVAFIVSDCGYNDLQKLFCQCVRRFLHLPGFLAYTASLASRICYGYFYSQVKPLQYLKDNEIPICFIHGANDQLIPPENALEMHEANKGYSQVHLIKDAPHAESIFTDEAEYTRIVTEFLQRVE